MHGLGAPRNVNLMSMRTWLIIRITSSWQQHGSSSRRSTTSQRENSTSAHWQVPSFPLKLIREHQPRSTRVSRNHHIGSCARERVFIVDGVSEWCNWSKGSAHIFCTTVSEHYLPLCLRRVFYLHHPYLSWTRDELGLRSLRRPVHLSSQAPAHYMAVDGIVHGQRDCMGREDHHIFRSVRTLRCPRVFSPREDTVGLRYKVEAFLYDSVPVSSAIRFRVSARV